MRTLRGPGFVLFLGALVIAVPAAPASAAFGDLAGVDPGDWVEAELMPDGSSGWATRELDIKGRPKSGGGSVVGPLERMADGGTVLGLHFSVGAATSVKDTLGDNITFDSVPDGEIVEVRIARAGDGYEARKIRMRPRDTAFEVEGIVEDLRAEGRPSVRILGIEALILDDVRVRKLHKRPRFIRLTDDDDPIPASRLSLGPLTVGATATFEVDPEKNYDLNRDRPRDLSRSTVSSRLEVSGRMSDAVRLFAKGGYRRRFILEDQRNTKTGFESWELAEAYLLYLGFLRPEIVLQVGRQDFDEAHEWIHDENLDAVRLHYFGGRIRAEAAVASRIDSVSSRLSGRWSVLGSVTTAVTADVSAGGWFVASRPRGPDPYARLTWVGARILSLKSGPWRGWAELSRVTGSDNDTPVRGSAFHLSGSRILHRPTRFTLNAAWARGSGDDDPLDNRDAAYRQTGFQDNNDRFEGVTSFRYYGELVDPELSNLDVKTVGVGIRPISQGSVDLVVHRLRQVNAAPFLRNAALDVRPSGLSTDIGTEVDLVFGFRHARNLKLEWVLGVLRAGKAFPDDTERAVMSHLQMDVSF